MWSNIHTDKTFLDVLDVYLGIDNVEIDDEHFFKGMFRRSKAFLNVKSSKFIKSFLEYY